MPLSQERNMPRMLLGVPHAWNPYFLFPCAVLGDYIVSSSSSVVYRGFFFAFAQFFFQVWLLSGLPLHDYPEPTGGSHFL